MDLVCKSLLLLMALSTQVLFHESNAFKVAVFEHKVIFSTATFKVMPRYQAVKTIEPNLKIYATQVKKAAKQGADMIVFPEDGIYGLMFSRKSIRSFLEQIPDPKSSHWNPCLQKYKSITTHIQNTLSCLARQNSIMIVANMGEYIGDKQYNTDVVFDSTGLLVAKYHKYHLFYEPTFDTPRPEYITFDTPFGTFGVATCFDLQFKTPVVNLIEQKNVTNLVVPMAWMKGFPYLMAFAAGDAFARAYGINLLTANFHLPRSKFGGSGIFGPDGAHAYYYDSDSQSDGKLLIADIKKTAKIIKRSSSSYTAPFSTKLVPSSARFTKTIMDAEYDLVEISGTSGQLQMCKGELCCYLDFQRSASSSTNMYAFGAADGKLSGNLKFNAQSCLLLECASNTQDSCGKEIEMSSTIFQKLRLSGNFRPVRVPMPQIIFSLSGQKLGLKPSDWTFNSTHSLIEGYNMKEPVVSASLYARKF